MSVKMTKQHIFVIENNLQKVGVIFALSDNRGTRSTCPTSVFTGIRQTLMSRPVTDKLSHNVVHLSLIEIRTHNISGGRH
jgi:hypothetical protein